MRSTGHLAPPPPLAEMLSQGHVALFLDFDGTLVELASGPDAIAPRTGLANALHRLGERLGGRCAVVSGRGIADIERHVGTLRVAVAGSHGSDMRTADGSNIGESARELPARIEGDLRAYADRNGLDYEAKPHGGALHYRSDSAKGPDAEAFARDLAERHGWAAQPGKCVVEIVAATANKGAAVRAFMQQPPFAGALPYFLGDDLTDEAGFAACEEFGGGGILIGERAGSRAHYRLESVSAVHDWLDL